MDKFDFMCDNISGFDVNGNRYGKPDENGVSAWYSECDYDEYIDCKWYQPEPIEVEYNGKMYYEHWFFVNEKHDSNVCGYSIMSEDGDVQFYIVGCKLDRVCSFETLYQYLTDSAYFVD